MRAVVVWFTDLLLLSRSDAFPSYFQERPGRFQEEDDEGRARECDNINRLKNMDEEQLVVMLRLAHQ